MKKNLVTLILGGILSALPLAADEWTDPDTGYTWTYRINGETAEVYDDYGVAILPSPTGAVAIPSALGGKPVTSIGHEAFRSCSGLTSVTIPDSVTSIGDDAFSGCSGLTSVTIPDSVTSIGNGAFFGCSWLKSVTIPDSVTGIGAFAFFDCSGLKSVTIPDSVTSIGDYAFRYCFGLTSVTIPVSVTSIGDDAFSDCSGIRDVTISQYVLDRQIGNVFPSSYSIITNVSYSAIITNIGYHAFYNCSGLTSVTIPDSVTSINWGAFYGCSGLTSVRVVAGDADRAKSLLIGSGYDVSSVTFIEDGGGSGGGGSVTLGYEVLDAKDITAPYEAPKAVTLQGVAYDGDAVAGAVELKLGKVSKGKSKVSGSFTGLDGKKIAIKAVNVTDINGTTPVTVSLEVKGHGTMAVTIGGDKFAGSLGGWHVQSGTVGGNWAKGTATVGVDAGDVSMFAGRVLRDLLPNSEQATVNGGKWAFKKAAGVKWAKPKKDAVLSKFYDEDSDKDLIVDDTKDKTNLSGLKLTYTPKKGTFKGSFKVYALEGVGKTTKLKKYTVTVTGLVVEGVGYGQATCKKPAASWAVTVE